MDQERFIEYLYLCKSAIDGDEYKAIDKSQLELFFELSLKNNMIPILYTTIAKSSENREDNQYICDKWKAMTIRKTLLQMRANNELKRIINLFNENMVTHCVFKGIIIADLYPEFNQRQSCDSDIYIPVEYAKKAEKILGDCGYTYIEAASKRNVPVFAKERILTIELHYCLWEDDTGIRADEMEKMKLCDVNTFVRVNVCGITCLTLGHTEHLIFQIYHIFKHFALNGVGIRNLIDITLFYNRYMESIDINRFWEAMNRLSFFEFALMTYTICIEYFGMDKSVLMGNVPRKINNNYLNDIINVGMVGQGVQSWRFMEKLTPYYEGKDNIEKNKVLQKITYLFPSPKKLGGRYNYAKKINVLLPVAWVHRIIYNIFTRVTRKDDLAILKSMNIIHDKLNLMDELGLLYDTKNEINNE